jgi:hypothetical protein
MKRLSCPVSMSSRFPAVLRVRFVAVFRLAIAVSEACTAATHVPAADAAVPR